MMKNTITTTSRFLYRNRHHIADGLMLVAFLLRNWNANQAPVLELDKPALAPRRRRLKGVS